MSRKRFLIGFFVLMALVLAYLAIPPQWPAALPVPTSLTKSQRRCQMIRDRFDTPHILAQDSRAAMYCWGRVQALDRAWQMDYLRRVAYGRLAELYGLAHVKQDFLFRILGLAPHAKRLEAAIQKDNAKHYDLLQHYVWGVNAGFQELRQRGPMPYQYKKVGLKIAPWRLQDTMMIFLLQSFFQTRKNFTSDLKAAKRRLRLGPTRYKAIYGNDTPHPQDTTIIKSGEHTLVPAQAKVPTTRPRIGPSTTPSSKRTQLSPSQRQRQAKVLTQIIDWFGPRPGFRWGSNNWVIAPSRTKRGHAMMANDPHLAPTTPHFWHESHLRVDGDFNVMGVSVPGAPSIASGHNQYLAWGITNGYTNVTDLVKIRIKQGQFRLGSTTHKVETFRPVVRVKVGPFYIPIFWKSFERTKLGPLLPQTWAKDERLLLRWSGYHLTKNLYAATMGMVRSKTIQDFNQALIRWELPCWNIVFADRKGQIGYRQIGKMPLRKAGRFGLIDANDPKQLWQGWLKAHEKPFVLNPKRGFLATANNRVFPAHYPYFTGHAFARSDRATRIEQLIQQQAKHDLASMKRIQTDYHLLEADFLLPTMLAKLKSTMPHPTGKAQEALVALERWNRRSLKTLVAPTIYRVWYRRLEQQLFRRDGVRPGPRAVMRVLEGKLKAGNDKAVPTILRASFQYTLAKLSKDLGSKLKTWTWGRYHTVSFPSMLKNRPQWSPGAQPMDGDTQTVSPGATRGDGPFVVKNAASYRIVVELGPRIRSFGVYGGRARDVAPTTLSPQQKLWLNNQYRPRPFYPNELAKYQKSKDVVLW